MPCFPSERLGRAAETRCEMLVYVIQTRAVHLEEGGPGSLAAPSFLPSFPPNLLFSAELMHRSRSHPPTSLPSFSLPLLPSNINFSSELTPMPEPD